MLAGWSRRFRIAISGVNPRTKRPFIWHLFHARGGGGACAAGDGWETAGEGQAAGGIKFGSVEVAETRFPLFFARHEFRPDSPGDGRYRGGVGSLLTLKVETTEEGRANTAGDGVRHPSYGILGGKDGLPHRYRMRRAAAAPASSRPRRWAFPCSPAPCSWWSPPAAAATATRAGATPPRAARRDNGLITARTGAFHRANPKMRSHQEREASL